MKKILFVTASFVLSGAEKQLYTLVKNLDKRKADIRVIGFGLGGYFEEFKKIGIPVYHIENRSLSSRLRFTKKHIAEFKPDVVNSWLPLANIICKMAKILSRHKFKLIPSIRSKAYGLKFWIAYFLERILDFTAELTVVNSHATKKQLKKVLRFGKNRLVVIHNGYEFEKATSLKEIKNLAEHRIMTVANFREKKDYKTNIKTCSELIKKQKNIVFIYVGEGPELQEMKQLVKKKRLNKYIKFMGARKDVPRLLKSSSVFFLPTLCEGLSNAIIEAMYYSVPIVTTSIAENKELITHGQDGILCPIKNYKCMSSVINQILTDKKMREKLAQNAFRKSKKFTISQYLKKYSEILLK